MVRILDATCGGRMIWYDKHHPGAVYVDRRIVPKGHPLCRKDNPGWQVLPDVVASFTALPFADNVFDLVVFDPPHKVAKPDAGILHLQYGTLDKGDWRDVLRVGWQECWRVLRPGGSLCFKWAESCVPLSQVLALFHVRPLFKKGNRNLSKTSWSIFFKRDPTCRD